MPIIAKDLTKTVLHALAFQSIGSREYVHPPTFILQVPLYSLL